jgi:GcrA cell cycle regulator
MTRAPRREPPRHPSPPIAPAKTCRWIDGDVREPGWRYCGQPTLVGRSWCAEHHARAYHRGGVVDIED